MTFRNSRAVEIQEIWVTVLITGAEPRKQWSGGKSPWRPESITVKWTRRRVATERWGTWDWSAHVNGPYLRKDGTPYGMISVRVWVDDDPEWGAAIAATRPADHPPEAYLQEHAVTSD